MPQCALDSSTDEQAWDQDMSMTAEGAMAHQGGGHAGNCACCQACGDAEIALPVPQSPLCSLICAQLYCTVGDDLQYLHVARVCSHANDDAMWIADPSKRAATIYHGFSAPLILSPLQGRTTASCMFPPEARPVHLRNIALPVAKEALLLADGCQRTNDAPAPGGLFEGPSLQPPSCLQQELDPVQRRRQCLPCRANNTFTMRACGQAPFLQERSLRLGAISGDSPVCRQFLQVLCRGMQGPTGTTITKEMGATVRTGVMHPLPAFLCTSRLSLICQYRSWGRGRAHLERPQLLRL
jgi:hypothetical protein